MNDMEKKKRRFITSVYFQDIFAIPLAKFLIGKKVHPNLVTLVGAIFSLFSGYCYLTQSFLLGSVLFLGALILDSTDGRVARGTNTFSKFGAILDAISDKFRSTFVALLLLLGLGLDSSTLMFIYGYYILLPVIRLIIGRFSKLKDDPTVVFWDATPLRNWLLKKNLVGLYNGWERAVLCLVIAPLTPYPIYVFLVAIALEQVIYVAGLILYLQNRNG